MNKSWCNGLELSSGSVAAHFAAGSSLGKSCIFKETYDYEKSPVLFFTGFSFGNIGLHRPQMARKGPVC
jgi:hypothetical protein